MKLMSADVMHQALTIMSSPDLSIDRGLPHWKLEDEHIPVFAKTMLIVMLRKQWHDCGGTEEDISLEIFSPYNLKKMDSLFIESTTVAPTPVGMLLDVFLETMACDLIPHLRELLEKYSPRGGYASGRVVTKMEVQFMINKANGLDFVETAIRSLCLAVRKCYCR